MGEFTAPQSNTGEPVVPTDWEKVLSDNAPEGPVAYYFHSEHCKFCDEARPWVEAISKKYAAKNLRIVKINTDKQNNISQSAGVTGVPVLIFTDNGSPLTRVTGWGDLAHTDIEVRLGLTDFFDEKSGLLEHVEGVDTNSMRTIKKDEAGTCEGCGDSSNAGIAQLAEGITAEFDQIRRELAEIKQLILGSK
jgi:thiol-disulfide isomerase/thioredoxin